MRARSVFLGLALGIAAWPAIALALGRGEIGTSGAQFLKLAPGARPVGMGEAFSGVADDIHAIYYNPAGLAFLDTIQAAAAHASYFQGIRYEFGAVAVPLLSWVDTKEPRHAHGVAGLAVYNLNAGSMERRGTTETDAPVGTFQSSDFAYELAYAYAPMDRLALGADVKFIEQHLDTAKASAVSMDAGGLYRAGRVSLGAGVRHLGTQPKFSRDCAPLPLLFYLGGGLRPRDGWLVSADLRFPRDNDAGLSLGTEYTRQFSKGLAGSLRMGFNSSNQDPDGLTGLGLGGGVRYNRLDFDFAWVPFGDLGNTFRYSFLLRF